MRITRHKRQIFLFLAAILVPAGVLIGLAGRIMSSRANRSRCGMAGHCSPMLVRQGNCIRLDSLTLPAGLLHLLGHPQLAG
jgi:hypothetical protein